MSPTARSIRLVFATIILITLVNIPGPAQTADASLSQRIFAPPGMKNSYYDRTARIIPRRVAGYAKTGAEYSNATYLSMNWPHGAGALPQQIASLVMGKSYQEPIAITLTTEQLDPLAGIYSPYEKVEYRVMREGDKLYLARPLGGRQPLEPLSATESFLKSSPATRIVFLKDDSGKATSLKIFNRLGPDETARRIN